MHTTCLAAPTHQPDVHHPPVALAGTKKDQAKEREAGLRKAKEGCDALPKPAFKYLCGKLLASVNPNALFALCFMVVAWNLCSRMDEVNTLHTDALSWAADALTVMFWQSKKDKQGKHTHAFHCFGNPDSPETCIMTVLAMYLSTHQERGDEANPKLFPGNKTQDTFNKCLKDLWKDEGIIQTMAERFRLCVKDLSAYMTRKGSSTTLTSDCSDPPSLMAVFLRCKWSNGVRDAYIQFGVAGDQHCGRILAGLEAGTWKFGHLPWHWVEMDDVIRDATRRQFPTDSKAGRLVNVLHNLMAALVGNLEYIKTTVAANSPLRSTWLFAHATPEQVRSLPHARMEHNLLLHSSVSKQASPHARTHAFFH